MIFTTNGGWAFALVFALAAPLALSAAMLARGWRAKLMQAAPWAAAPALFAALAVPVGTEVEIPWLVLGARLGLDATGQTFLFFTALLWLIAGLFGLSYLATDENRGRFFAFYLLAMSGNLGLILAMDIAGFYTFFALMSFSSYGLVVHHRDAESLRAGRIYIYLVVLGEIMLFAAFILIAANAGTLQMPVRAVSAVAIGLALFGFGIKAGMLPLHVWLPLAHPVAPTPASAVLSGAMIKAGLIGWMRFLPVGETARPEWGNLMVALGFAAAFYGALVGVTQRNPKTVLAYSSISQMGLMTIGVGIGLADPENWGVASAAVLLYALHHALAKGALFLGVGVAEAAGRNARPWVTPGLILPALSLTGAPLTSGAIAKAALKPAAAGFTGADWLAVLLSLAAVGTTLLMARFMFLVWPRAIGAGHLTRGLWAPWAFLVAATSLTMFAWPTAIAIGRAQLHPLSWWPATWPVIFGVMISGAAWMITRRGATFVQIPAGDIVALAAPAGARLAQFWRASGISGLIAALIAASGSWLTSLQSRFSSAVLPIRLEQNLRRWSSAGLALLRAFAKSFFPRNS